MALYSTGHRGLTTWKVVWSPLWVVSTGTDAGSTTYAAIAPDADRPTAAVVVHRSALLDALSALFESYWERAVPIVIGADGALGSEPPAPPAADVAPAGRSPHVRHAVTGLARRWEASKLNATSVILDVNRGVARHGDDRDATTDHRGG
jgi:hypothetical protein